MNSAFDLSERTVVVTGAGRGIGRAISEIVLAAGGNIVAVDLDREGLADLARAQPDQVLVAHGSVVDETFAKDTIVAGVARFGALHGLVNNAGIVRAAMIPKMTRQSWQDVLDVHLTGSFNFLQAIGDHFIARRKAGQAGPCSIVNISSDAGRRGTIGQINYGAAKSALLGLTMSAAREWGRHEIRVNSVCFGMVETEMTETIRSDQFRERYLAQIPFGRWGSPAEVAQPVCFLLSEAAAYITGQHLSVNGGYHIGF